MPRQPDIDQSFYAAADRFVDACLREQSSLFTPGRPVWAHEPIAELYTRFVENPDESDAGFIQKLVGQLEGAGDLVVELAAEALYMLLLAQHTSASPKRVSVSTILEAASEPIEIPEELSRALAHGFSSFGGALIHRFPQYCLLLEFARAWTVCDEPRRAELLTDSGLFREFLFSLDGKGAASQVEALLYIVFPDDFEPITSVGVKKKIIEVFDPDGDTSLTRDVRLGQIRAALTSRYGEGFSFYDADVRARWDAPNSREPHADPLKPGWEEFLSWAQRLYEYDGFDSVERDYKLEAARALSAARAASEVGDDWLPMLEQALRGNNLMNWRPVDRFVKWSSEQPEECADAVRTLWRSVPASASSVTQFATRLPPEIAPGNGVALAAVLLMAIDGSTYPPYRPTVDEHARKLVGIPTRAQAIQLDKAGTYRPDALASMLGVTGRAVRGFLREHFARPADEKNTDWYLDGETARAVVERFRPSTSSTTAGERYFSFLELLDALTDRLGARKVTLRDRLDAQSLVWWVTNGDPPEGWSEEDQAAFLAYRSGNLATAPGPATLRPEVGSIPPINDAFAQGLHLPRDWLQGAVDLLNEKRQVIFYGPPGTGKTFIAQAVGEHIRTGASGGDWQLVQFHPSYSYEDFFEGYRPAKSSDGATLYFDLRSGPLRLIAEAAAEDPERPHLLIIDEINRGNIAKVFGELYFLLEYRDRPVRLQYSPEEEFRLPDNLFVLGTMNTADRSIALIDSALRRRFYFYPFLPREEPLSGVLTKWLKANAYDEEPAYLLTALNTALHEALPDDEFSFGPSYFMPSAGPPNLERVWSYAIMPLLEERFYGAKQSDEIEQEFGLAAIRARLRASKDEDEDSARPDGEPQA